MPVMVIIHAPKVTPLQYEAVRDQVGWVETPAVGAISHAIAFTDAGAVEVNLWESREAFDTYFATRLKSVLQAFGIQLDDIQVLDTHTVAVGEPCLAYLVPTSAGAAKASVLVTAH